jgi:hypothetical protein
VSAWRRVGGPPLGSVTLQAPVRATRGGIPLRGYNNGKPYTTYEAAHRLALLMLFRLKSDSGWAADGAPKRTGRAWAESAA